MKKKIISIVTAIMFMMLLLPGDVLANGDAEYQEIPELAYTSVAKDCNIHVYATEGGTVNMIAENDPYYHSFGLLVGYRQYQAVPAEGYRFVGFTYELTCKAWLPGNGIVPNESIKTVFRGSEIGTCYRVSACNTDNKASTNAKTAYVSGAENDKIQLNRLLTVGESCKYPLTYKIYAKFEKIPTYTVTYTDGVEDEEVFADQTTTDILEGSATPAFEGTPTRSGYVFGGWEPAVAETVTADATYTATWKEDINNNGTPDEEEDKYTVTYTDGVDGEEVFADQVTEGLLSGMPTPEFDGVPTREGYTFKGWDPAVEETVSGNAVYTAVWEKDPVIDDGDDEDDGDNGNDDPSDNDNPTVEPGDNTDGNHSSHNNTNVKPGDKNNTKTDSKKAASKSVKTGDNSHVGIWAVLMVLCMAVIIRMTVGKKAR